MNPFDQVFGPVIRQSPRKPHAYSDDTRPAPVDYGSMPLPSYGSGDQHAPDQYTTVLTNFDDATRLITEFSNDDGKGGGTPASVAPFVRAQPVGLTDSVQFTRPFEWFIAFAQDDAVPAVEGSGIASGWQFFLGNSKASGVLPVGVVFFREDAPAPGYIRRAPLGVPPPLYRIRFDKVRCVSTGVNSPLRYVVMAGRGLPPEFLQTW